ncbi:hypothetical protein [Methylomonas sp. MgM2]
MFRSAAIALIALPASSSAWADRGDWDDYDPGYYVERVYVPQPVVEYIPVQPYYAPPPPPSYGYYYQPPAQGLIGGMLGSAVAYQLGGGDPLAAGFGAAAGSWFGNGAW